MCPSTAKNSRVKQWLRIQCGVCKHLGNAEYIFALLGCAEACGTTSTLFLAVLVLVKLTHICLPVLQSHLGLQCRHTHRRDGNSVLGLSGETTRKQPVRALWTGLITFMFSLLGGITIFQLSDQEVGCSPMCTIHDFLARSKSNWVLAPAVDFSLGAITLDF